MFSLFPFLLVLSIQFLVLLQHGSFEIIEIRIVALVDFVTLGFAVGDRDLVVDVMRDEGLFDALEEWLHCLH